MATRLEADQDSVWSAGTASASASANANPAAADAFYNPYWRPDAVEPRQETDTAPRNERAAVTVVGNPGRPVTQDMSAVAEQAVHRSNSEFDAPSKPSLEDKAPIKAWLRRNWWWVVPLHLLLIAGIVVYIKYEDQIAEDMDPVRAWLAERKAWSWSIPTAILIVLSMPPLVGQEFVQLIVGLAYPLGIAIAIAIAGTVIGEAIVFVVFKYTLTERVQKKCDDKTNWAAVARVCQESGIFGVLMIRYSIIPPHLANPVFAATGMSFWLYILTVILSLPKQIVFVIIGYPANKDRSDMKAAKILSILAIIAVTIWGSIWLKRKLRIAKREIAAERDVELMEKTRQAVKAQSA